jgi:cytochrome b561
MQLRNDGAGFGAITISLHWMAAVCVLAMLFTAAGAMLAPNEDAGTSWMLLHGAIGVLVWLVIAARIIWHFLERRPAPLTDQPRLNRAAGAVHLLLLLLIALQLLTGPLDVWTGGWAIRVFDWFAVSSPLGTALGAWHDRIGDVHRYTGYAIALVLTVHVAGALKHALVDRDRTLPRMLGRSDRSDG